MYFYGLYCGTLCVWEGCACVGEGRWVVREREHREHSDDDDVEPFLVLFLLYFVSTVSVCVCLHCSYVFFGISGKLNFPPLDIKTKLVFDLRLHSRRCSAFLCLMYISLGFGLLVGLKFILLWNKWKPVVLKVKHKKPYSMVFVYCM